MKRLLGAMVLFAALVVAVTAVLVGDARVLFAALAVASIAILAVLD